MLDKFDAALGGGIKAKFASKWPLEKTRYRIGRLTQWTKDSPNLQGSVVEDQVRLSVTHVTRSNGTAFRGQIKAVNNEVFLEGAFGSAGFAQAASILGLSFLAVIGIGAVTTIGSAMLESGDVFSSIMSLLIFVMALLGFGALLVWNASPDSKDIKILTVAIENALGSDA